MTRSRAASRKGRWALQDAKARFSEVVRKAKAEGPQHVTVRGREEVVILSIEEYRRAKGESTGKALVDVLRHSPLDKIDMERRSLRSRVRRVKL